MMDKLASVLAELATKLGTTVEHLWPAIVKYRVASLVGDATLSAVVLGVGATILSKTLMVAAWDQSKKNQYNRECGSLTVGIVCTAGGFIATTICLPAAIAAVISPEGSATMWLLRMIGGGR